MKTPIKAFLALLFIGLLPTTVAKYNEEDIEEEWSEDFLIEAFEESDFDLEEEEQGHITLETSILVSAFVAKFKNSELLKEKFS